MEDRAFVKQDLKRIGLVFGGILFLFIVLYYIESQYSSLTNLLS